MKFIDTAKITVKSGNGGDGAVSFRREKFVPKGGPDGGDGGDGGSVVLKADPRLDTLLDFHFKRIYKANSGRPGEGKNKSGKSGVNLIVNVPPGTIVKLAETEEFVADLAESGDTFEIAKGGSGGFGNARFATATNQAPRFAKPGTPGEEKEILLELKLIADVGIVGLPSVGKSTLISTISAAKPKIAEYHFTTLIPNLGVVKIAPGQNFVVADIPGLIEGAHAGKGLGHQFLRHAERSAVLLFLLESISDDPERDYKILFDELIKYNPDFDGKERIIAVSKIDLADEETRESLAKLEIEGQKPILFSAATRENLDEVVYAMWNKYKSTRNLG